MILLTIMLLHYLQGEGSEGENNLRLKPQDIERFQSSQFGLLQVMITGYLSQ